MKLSFSILSVAVIAVFLTICLFEYGEARCGIACTYDFRPVCGKRGSSKRTFSNRCELNRENKCNNSGRDWVLVSNKACH
ncbi:vasotab-like [Rhodnius prolixus]|uniref:Putative kazal type serine protease inhibitor n=1 Tax=Rhodnius prolixus TaxID=13249 RepID=R4G490_RHOPR